MNCPDCRRTLAVGATNCQCGWSGFAEKKLTFKQPCHFESDGKCKFYAGKGASVRINDFWICNYHYEHGYDRVLRSGQEMSLAEMKINGRLFGEKEADAERQAIQEESA